MPVADYTKSDRGNKRPASILETPSVFIECVTCGKFKVLSLNGDITDSEAITRAQKIGWQVAGTRGHKNTRCKGCRDAVWWGRGARNRTFAETDPRYGMYSRGPANPKPIQRSHGMKHPDNPPLASIEPTTIPIELLRGKALMAHVEAIGEHPSWAPPDPLKRCTRCAKHAALYSGDADEFFCGVCGPRVSIFRTPVHADDLRQRAADLALEQFEKGQSDG